MFGNRTEYRFLLQRNVMASMPEYWVWPDYFLAGELFKRSFVLVDDGDAVTPKFCYYGNMSDPDSIRKFGALYNWYIVNPANENKIAPSGWHVPSDADWDSLQNYLVTSGYNWDGTTEDDKTAKSMAATTGWDTSFTRWTVGHDMLWNNTSGFSALPGGERNYNGVFCNIGSFCYWLSATPIDESSSFSRDLCSTWGHIYRDYGNKSCGFSVRLVRDD
jgi:uncharacterized protein (TIGR02145 family)